MYSGTQGTAPHFVKGGGGRRGPQGIYKREKLLA